MIDTVVLAGNSFSVEDGRELNGNELKGWDRKAETDAQLAWIEATLRNSSAPYLVVAGHYPVHSICEHGPTAALVDHLQPLLEQYNVTA